MSEEEWRTLEIYKSYFSVSSTGRVRANERRVRFVSKGGVESFRVKAARIMALNKQNGGYLLAHLNIDGVRYAPTVHSLVAHAFLGPRPKGLDICHINGDREDNRACNLRYDTRANNCKDRVTHGTVYLNHGTAKLSEADARFIKLQKGKQTTKSLAKKFRLKSTDTVSRIWRGATWKFA